MPIQPHLAPADYDVYEPDEVPRKDKSGTPRARISSLAQNGDVAMFDGQLPVEQEANILIEHVCGSEFEAEHGYGRFVKFRKPIECEGRQVNHALAHRSKNGPLVKAKQAALCDTCGYRGATEYGLCSICGAPKLDR